MLGASVVCCWFWYCARMWACGSGGCGCTPYVWWMIVCVSSCWRLFGLSSTRLGLLTDKPPDAAWFAWCCCSCLIICCCCDKSSALSGCWNCDLSCGCLLNEEFQLANVTSEGLWVKYFRGACRTGVFWRDRLVDEHIDADRLALSQWCTSELRRASSMAISVSLLGIIYQRQDIAESNFRTYLES